MLWSTSSMVEVVDAGKCNCVMREQISIEWKRVIWRKKIVALLIRCLSFYSKIQQDHEIAKECSSFLRRNIGVIPLKWGNTKLKIVCQATKKYFICCVSIDTLKVLPTNTFEGEMELFDRFLDNGVAFYPGAWFLCAEPGWFRLVFAMESEILQLGKLWRLFFLDNYVLLELSDVTFTEIFVRIHMSVALPFTVQGRL